MEAAADVPRLTRKNARTQEATGTPTEVTTARSENKKPLKTGTRGNVPIPFLQVTLPVTSQTLHKSLFEPNTTYQTAANFTNVDSHSLIETDLTMKPILHPASEPQATASAENLTVIQRDYSRKPSVLWPQDANCSRYYSYWHCCLIAIITIITDYNASLRIIINMTTFSKRKR